MSHRRHLIVLPLLTVALTACRDATGPATADLSPAEAAALALALDNSSSDAVKPQASENGPSFNLAPSPIAKVRSTQRSSFDVDLPCPLGGTANLSGEHLLEVDLEQGFIRVDVTAERAHHGCAVRTEEGTEITVDGVLTFAAERELREGRATASQRHSGSLDYATDEGQEGRCEVDITTTFSLVPGKATRTILGSVCGHDVEVSTEWSETT